MNEQPRRKLREIVERHGHTVIQNARRCEGLLRDYSGRHRREVSVLVSALEEHVPQDLLTSSAGAPREVLLKRLARRLTDQQALSEQAAAWAVNSWAFALGLISDDELRVFEEAGAAAVTADLPVGDVGRAVDTPPRTTPKKAAASSAAGP